MLFRSIDDQAINILIIAEYHTRNLNYLHNLNILKSCLEAIGKKVRITSISTELTDILKLTDITRKEIIIEPPQRIDNKIILPDNFCADLIIVNNDFSSGSPELLQNISQTITPPTGMGWYKRSKYNHFLCYNKASNEFAQEFNFDPFFIQTECDLIKNIDFRKEESLEKLAKKAEKTLAIINEKYQKYSIKQDPYLYLKIGRAHV